MQIIGAKVEKKKKDIPLFFPSGFSTIIISSSEKEFLDISIPVPTLESLPFTWSVSPIGSSVVWEAGAWGAGFGKKGLRGLSLEHSRDLHGGRHSLMGETHFSAW